MPGKIVVETRERIGWITFDNPDKRNAMSLAMWQDLAGCIAAAEQNEEIRVLALTGSGGKAFVSGSDVSSFGAQRNTPEAVASYNAAVETALSALASFAKPSVAIISGYCIGGGVSIAAACDLRFAEADASFAVPAGKLGVGYSRHQIERLQMLVGPSLVRDLIFTARRMDATEAQARGLLDVVVDKQAFAERIADRLSAISGNAPLTLRAAKRASQNASLPFDKRDDVGVDRAIADCFASADYKEGQAAFAEKRQPVFSGR